ncbi:MAG: hypothetical protein ABL903_18230 [Methylococcales bacterium]
MNQTMDSKKLRLSMRECMRVIAISTALTTLLPTPVYCADEIVVNPLHLPEPTQGITENESVITPTPAQIPSQASDKTKVRRIKNVATNVKPLRKPIPTGEDAIISKLEFKQANMVDVVRALADMSGLNIVATDEAAKKSVTVFLQNITVKNALDTISKNSGLWYRQDKISKTFRVMSTDEFQRDMVVYREDTTRVFELLHPNPVIVATAIRDIFPNRVKLTLGVTDPAAIGAVNTGVRQATTRQTRNAGAGVVATPIGNQRLSEQMITEKLTPDQLAKLDAVAKSKDGGAVSSEELNKISGSEQPIYLTLNREHNLIIVRSSDNAAIKEIERLIKEMDKPTTQVLLEMKILALDVGDSFRQSFDVDYLAGTQTNGPLTDQRRNPLGTPAPTTITSTITNTSPVGTNPVVNTTSTQTGTLVSAAKNILGLGNFGLEGGTFVYQFMNNNIRARLQLLAENHSIQTLSSPILLASNNKPAKVFVGVEQVITTGFEAIGANVTAGATTGTTVVATSIVPVTEVRNIGNTLQILPKINADGTVTLEIQQDSSSVIIGGATIPLPIGGITQYFNVDTVKTSNLEGTVVAKDGLTVAIGGLIDSSTSNSVQKVPLLGDIPVLGNLFQRKVESKSKRELILLITPHIIMAPADTENVTQDAMETISEQEW